MYVTVTDGKDDPLTGKCIYFIRNSSETEISIRNIGEVSFSVANGDFLVHGSHLRT